MNPVELRPHRPCVGIMLVNQRNKVFVARRVDVPGNHWQMPQGGIDNNECPRDAALREMKEEIGTNNAELIGECPEWYAYDLPVKLSQRLWKGQYRGQTQKWFAFRYLGQDSDINLNTEIPEFSEWQWVGFNDLLSLIVPFKRDVYERVVGVLRPLVEK